MLEIMHRNSKSESFKKLDYHIHLMKTALLSLWEGNRSSEYKFPTLFKVKMEMCCDLKLLDELFGMVLAHLIQRGDVILKEDSRGEFRVWNSEGLYFRKKAYELYEFLESEWENEPTVSFKYILTVYKMNEGFSEEFLRNLVIYLRDLVLIDVFRGGNGTYNIMPLISKKTKKDILEE